MLTGYYNTGGLGYQASCWECIITACWCKGEFWHSEILCDLVTYSHELLDPKRRGTILLQEHSRFDERGLCGPWRNRLYRCWVNDHSL